MIVTEEFNKDRYDELLFDEVKSIDADQDYWFKLRGDNQNKMVDAATPLLGLSLRIRSLAQCENIETIYKQAQEEIKAIEMELVQADIEHAMIILIAMCSAPY